MPDDRKYKQRGYMEDERKLRPSAPSKGVGGARLPVITATREMVRCDACGAELSTNFAIGFDSRCPKCSAELHSCRDCLHLDPAARFECAQPVRERIQDKAAANRCDFFEARRIKVRDTSRGTSPSPDDARRALENLFRKK